LAKKAYAKAKEKVAIVGFAPSSMGLAPFTDKSFEIWGVNDVYRVVPRVDVLFELHSYGLLTSKDKARVNGNHVEWLQNNKTVPVFMQRHYDDIPMSLPYPLEQVTDAFGRYFTNTISYEVALAILLGFKEIHLYGIDMATDSEYGDQRPSVEYFLGLAAGRGIKVYVPNECDLLKCWHLYGYEDVQAEQTAVRGKARLAELQNRINSYSQQELAARDAKNQMLGAADDSRYWLRNHQYNEPKFEREQQE
jgi:hypothetical protein